MIEKILDEVFGGLKAYMSLYRLLVAVFMVTLSSPKLDKIFGLEFRSTSISDFSELMLEVLKGANFFIFAAVIFAVFGGGVAIIRFLSLLIARFNLWLSVLGRVMDRSVVDFFKEKESAESEEVFLDALKDKVEGFSKEIGRIFLLLDFATISIIVVLSYSFILGGNLYWAIFSFVLYFILYVEVVSYILRRYFRTLYWYKLQAGQED